MLNRTHDPARRSWIDSANVEGADFPIQNLPHGVFRVGEEAPRGGVAIGDQVLDLRASIEAGLFSGEVLDVARAAAEPSLNRLMAMGNKAASTLRARISDLLSRDGGERDTVAALKDTLLIPTGAVRMELPARIGGFTDFCTSIPHLIQDRPARPAGKLFRAFKYLPVAYNSRASSIVPDGATVRRPNGQARNGATGEISFAPSRAIDFELEFGAIVGTGNLLGQPVHIDDARDHIWGYVLVNDWSARDMQMWESMFGPFLSKNLRTSISAWVVTAEAMAPFRCAPVPRGADDPPVFPYLTSVRHESEGGFHVDLSATLTTDRMRQANDAPFGLTDTHLRYSFWSIDQILTHHASNGCNLQPGDVLATGTMSGPDASEAGCLLEITGGTLPLRLPNGENRTWIEDGDEITLRARAQAPGCVSISLGPCSGIVTPAVTWPTATAN